MQKQVVMDGEAKVIARGQTTMLEGDQAAALIAEAQMFPELTMADQAELLGAERLGDQNVYVIKWSENSKKFYDTETHLMVAQEVSADTPQGPMKTMTKFMDYKEVEGVMFPMTISQGMMGQNLKFEIKGIKVNSGLKKSDF